MRGHQRYFWVRQYVIFVHVFQTSQTYIKWWILILESKPGSLLSAFPLDFVAYRQARRVPWRHSIMFRTWCNRLFVFQIVPVCGVNIFVLFFSTLVASWPNLFLIAGLRVMIPGIALIVPIVSVIWEHFHMITSKFTLLLQLSGWN